MIVAFLKAVHVIRHLKKQNMFVKNVVIPHMTFPVNLKLNPWMNIRFDVHSHPDLKRKHISLNLKTINEV